MNKSQIKKLDMLWSSTVKELAKHECEYCGRKGYEAGGNHWLNACHIIGRRHRATRWDLENGMCLCYEHHNQYDEHGPQHDDIRKEVIGEKRMKRLLGKKNVIARNQDYETIKAELKRRDK